jgi:hypothetical protein
MRKVLTFLGASLSLTLAAVANAQNAPDMFKDVDTSHWAYPAVEDLRSKGIVIGYPDGYFRGKRTLTRYEFAVALDRALKQIGPGTAGPPGAPGAPGAPGEAGPPGPPGMTPEEVATLRRLTQEFRDELARLGNDIQAINRKLDNLAREVGELRARIDRMPVIYGHAYVGIRQDIPNGYYTDQNGVTLGKEPASTPGVPALRNAAAIIHDLGIGVRANIAGGAVLDAEIVSSTYKNFEGGNLGIVGGGYVVDPAADTYVHHAMITTPFNAIGRGSNFTIGRFGEQMGHLTLWKPTTDLYLTDPFEDDGMYYIDGARLKTTFGSVSFEAFGGKSSSVTGTNGGPWNQPVAGSSPLPTPVGGSFGEVLFTPAGVLGNKPVAQSFIQGHLPLDEIAGVSAGFGFNVLDRGGHIRLSALAGANTNNAGGVQAAVGYSNVLVLGLDGDIKLTDRVNFTADWGKSIMGMGAFSTVSGGANENNAFNATVGYGGGGLSLQAGYRYVDPQFYAPGYWGRIGNWVNPTNIQGPTVRAGYDVRPGIGVTVGGDFFGAARSRNASGGLGPNDQIDRILAGVRWDIAKTFRLTADWEGVYWKIAGPNAAIAGLGSGTVHPTEHYITIGTGYNLTSNTLLKLNYQIGEWDGHGAISNGPFGITRDTFNAITGQVAVKF